MPIYEYRCPACGKRFEVLHLAMTEGKEAECPRCHEPHASRVMSTFACASKRSGVDDPLLKDLPEDLRQELPPELANNIPDGVRQEVEAAGGLKALAEAAEGEDSDGMEIDDE